MTCEKEKLRAAQTASNERRGRRAIGGFGKLSTDLPQPSELLETGTPDNGK
jgi:hypothetical protein